MLSPGSGSTVQGTVEVSAGFISDSHSKATRVQLLVDGADYGSKILDGAQEKGVVSILWDSTRYADGARGLSVFIFSGKNQIGKAYVQVTVDNTSSGGVAKGSDLNKGASLIKFDNLRDGERVKGSRLLHIFPDKAFGSKVYVSLYVDKQLKYISNRNPFEFKLDTSSLTDGTHLVEAEVRDEGQEALAKHALRINVENKGSLADTIAQMSQDVPQTDVISAAPDVSIAALPASKVGTKDSGAARALDISSLYHKAIAPVKASKPTHPVSKPDTAHINNLPKSAGKQLDIVIGSDKPYVGGAFKAVAVPQPKPVAKPVVMAKLPDTAQNTTGKPVLQPAKTVVVQSAVPEVSPAAVKPMFKPTPEWEDTPAKMTDTTTLVRPNGLQAQVKTKPASSKPALQLQPQPTPVVKVVTIAPMAAPERMAKIPDSVKRMPNVVVHDQSIKTTPDVVAVTATPTGNAAPKQAPAKPENKTNDPVASLAAAQKLWQPKPEWSPLASRPVGTTVLARPKNLNKVHVAEEPRTTKTMSHRIESPKPVRMALNPPMIRKRPLLNSMPMLSVPEISEITFISYTERRPKMYQGSALVQLRKAVHQLGGMVHWDGKLKTATATLQGRKLVADLRSGTLAAVSAKGKTALGGLRLSLKNGRIMISATALAKSFNIQLVWDKEMRSVRIKRPVSSSKRSG